MNAARVDVQETDGPVPGVGEDDAQRLLRDDGIGQTAVLVDGGAGARALWENGFRPIGRKFNYTIGAIRARLKGEGSARLALLGSDQPLVFPHACAVKR